MINEPSSIEEGEDHEEVHGLKPFPFAYRALGVILYGFRGLNGLSNNLYWYEKGFNIARAASLAVVLYMKSTPTQDHWIKPLKPWDRYVDLESNYL